MFARFSKYKWMLLGTIFCPLIFPFFLASAREGLPTLSEVCARATISVWEADRARKWHAVLRDLILPSRRRENRYQMIRQILGTYFGDHDFEPVTTLDEAEVVAQFWHVAESPPVELMPKEERLRILNEAFRIMTGLPTEITNSLVAAGQGLDLIRGPVKHPDLMPVFDPHTGEEVPLAGVADKRGAIVSVDFIGKTGSANLILHELAHAYEYSLKGPLWPKEISASPEYQRVFSGTKFEKNHYHRDARECFAESFARYFHSAKTRRTLQVDQPLAFEFLEKRFGTLSFRYASPE